jgi:UDP-N-acetylmuramate: L-alanyl-gamma-D-glutamyl-meso-diaminopimelate ligase
MKRGVHREELAGSLAGADRVWLYQPEDLGWDLADVAEGLGDKASVARDIGAMAESLADELREGDQVLIMSNGSFGGLHERLLERLRARKEG